MSTLTVRPLKESDWTWLNKLPENVRPDKRYFLTPGTYGFVCEESKTPVGMAMGRATIPTSAKHGELTCYLDYIRARASRWDIFYALMRRHAQNGIDTGHKWAEARVPRVNCTDLGDMDALTSRIAADVRIVWNADGFDTTAQVVAGRRTAPVELIPLVTELDNWLAANGVVVIYV